LDFLVQKHYPWHPELITSFVLEYGQHYFVSEAIVKDANGVIVGVNGTVLDHYSEIGHSLLALLCGLAGGHASAYFYAQSRRPEGTADCA
jgi:hypothetical protein